MHPVVTLAANQHDPDVDAGLIATQLAALGDYVWFDRNNDGLQNEPPTAGANGVTVRLFLDNGNGTPDPATDAQVATTVTADDVYGRPGYYLFDGLIPGLHYFVQFVKPASATGFTTPVAGTDPTIDSNPRIADGVTTEVVLAPGEVNRTIDAGLVTAAGSLALGDQVWMDTNNNGIFEPQNGEVGVDGVRLNLYLDANNDGLPTLDEYAGSTSTATINGFAGIYRFSGLAPGNYIVVVDPSNFNGGGALAGKVSSTGNDPAPDPDDDVNGDDNGTSLGALTGSHPVTLTTGGEPTSEDGDANTNLTVDFGFFAAPATAQPRYDYGDAPEVMAGTARGNYNTTALNNGAAHLLGVPNAPYLGACVDADDGLHQNAGANADDRTTSDYTIGTCLVPGDDEDGVTFSGPFTPGGTAAFGVTSGGPTPCVLDAWVDWNQDGIFGDSPGEQIATDVTVPSSTLLNATVPAGAVPGLTYARFRCSSAGGLGPTGIAPDGEVEDYEVGVIGSDFGDAPASYGTQGAGAASHVVNPLSPLFLGNCVDTEPDGQPSVGADGDDNNAGTSRVGMCFDDEDGVTFLTPAAACQTAQLTVTANAPGKLDAWVDFGIDGHFDAGDQIFTSRALTAGANTLTYTVPCNATSGDHLRPLPLLLRRRPRPHRRRARRRGRGLCPQHRRRRLRRRAGQLRHAARQQRPKPPHRLRLLPRRHRGRRDPGPAHRRRHWRRHPRRGRRGRRHLPQRRRADRLLDGERAGDPHQHRRHRHAEARRLDRLRRRRHLQRPPRPRRHRPRARLGRQHPDCQRSLRRQVGELLRPLPAQLDGGLRTRRRGLGRRGRGLRGDGGGARLRRRPRPLPDPAGAPTAPATPCCRPTTRPLARSSTPRPTASPRRGPTATTPTAWTTRTA